MHASKILMGLSLFLFASALPLANTEGSAVAARQDNPVGELADQINQFLNGNGNNDGNGSGNGSQNGNGANGSGNPSFGNGSGNGSGNPSTGNGSGNGNGANDGGNGSGNGSGNTISFTCQGNVTQTGMINMNFCVPI